MDHIWTLPGHINANDNDIAILTSDALRKCINANPVFTHGKDDGGEVNSGINTRDITIT